MDARTGITHSFTTTAAHEHDLNQAGQVLHGEEAFIFADAGYRGAEKRAELKNVRADWHIAEQPGKLKTLKKHPRINKLRIRTEYLKASMRAKVEHPFRIIKCQFGFVKARYRGLMKMMQAGHAVRAIQCRACGSDVESKGLIRPHCLKRRLKAVKTRQYSYFCFRSPSNWILERRVMACSHLP